jgi:hypothetical protein
LILLLLREWSQSSRGVIYYMVVCVPTSYLSRVNVPSVCHSATWAWTPTKDNNVETPLLRAAENGHKAVVKLLLERGQVDVNVENKHGQTPLLLVAQNGRRSVVKLLLETD